MEREKLIQFLAQNGIRATAFSDPELRQQAQKILSAQRLNRINGISANKKGKTNSLSTKKIPDK